MNLSRAQAVMIAIGGTVTIGIGGFYLLKTHTTLMQGKPLHCKVFPTSSVRFPGEVEVCVTAIIEPYSPDNGDVVLQLTFMDSPRERVILDTIAWIANDLEGQGEYEGELNYSRKRVYEEGILAYKNERKYSAWVNPEVPKDVHLPMWNWLKDLRPVFDRPRLTFEEKFQRGVNSSVEFIAMATTAIVTAFKVITHTNISG
jgi:hypothetical protein